MANWHGRTLVKRLGRMVAVAATLTMVATGCTGDGDVAGRYPAAPDDRTVGDDDTLVVYSRDREAAEPIAEQFQRETGINVKARWGDPIDLADQIIADGADSPADVYYGPLSDALGKLSAAGRLAPLSDKQLRQVPEPYRSPDGTWVGTSGRAHVVFYNTDKLSEDDLPDSILGFADPAWRGRIGWDPTSRSLQDVVTQLIQLEGQNSARKWLKGIQADAPATIQGATPIVEAVAAGELVDVGFGSHSYLSVLQADGEAANVAAKFYPSGAPGGLLNLAGVGIVKGTDKEAAASAFIDFLLSRTVQRSFAEEEPYEIPLVDGVAPPEGMPTARELIDPRLDVRQFEELKAARRLLTEVGAIG